jgi:hypothetical protein
MIAIRLEKGFILAFGIALTFQLRQENLKSTFARVFQNLGPWSVPE